MNYCEPLATKDLEPSGFPAGEKRWRKIGSILNFTIGVFLKTVFLWHASTIFKRFFQPFAIFFMRHWGKGCKPFIERRASIELFADLAKGLKEFCHRVHIITVDGEGRLPPHQDAAGLR